MDVTEMHTRLCESVSLTLLIMNSLATASPETIANRNARALLVTDLGAAIQGLTDVAEALCEKPRKP